MKNFSARCNVILLKAWQLSLIKQLLISSYITSKLTNLLTISKCKLDRNIQSLMDQNSSTAGKFALFPSLIKSIVNTIIFCWLNDFGNLLKNSVVSELSADSFVREI